MIEKDIGKERMYRQKRLLQQRQVGTVIGLVVLGLLVMGMFLWGGSGTAVAESGDFVGGGAPGPDAMPGQALYNQYCFGCHGLTGDGNAAAKIPALNQNGIAWTRTRAELENHILDGGETMPELSGLVSPDDAALLIDFIQVWWTAEQAEAFNQSNQ